MNKITLILAITTAMFSSCSNSKKEDPKNTNKVVANKMEQIVGIASVEPKTRIITLGSEIGGIITHIFYNISDNVKTGDVIIELNSDVEQAQLEQAKSKLATQKAVVASVKSQTESSKIKLENAKANYNRNNNLIQSGGVTKQALDDSRFSFESLQADVATSSANINQQEGRLEEMYADIEYYEKLVERKKIKAPFDGKILSMDVEVGNYISPTQSVCEFSPKGQLIAITEVDELFSEDVKVGMKAYIRPQGKSDTLSTGTVFLTSPYLRKKSLFSDGATNMEDRRVREVRVLLDDDSKVIIGSRVECVILLNKQ